MSVTANPHERARRAEKVARLAFFLHAWMHRYDESIDVVRRFDRCQWETAAFGANVHPPSPKTISYVIALLESREGSHA